MNDIETYLDQACKSINGPEELRQHLRQELKEHLDEAIEALVAEGLSREEATRQAIEDLGEPETMRDEMESVHSPGVTSLFVDQAIKWRDRKWHIAAQLGLALLFATGIGWTTFIMLFIVPKLMHICFSAGVELPGFMKTTIGVCQVLWNYWWVWLLVLIGGLGLFEWKCRSESKAHMRTMMGVSLALLSVCVGFWVTSVTAVTFALVTPWIVIDKSIDIQEQIPQWYVVGPLSPDQVSKDLEEEMVTAFGQIGSTWAIPDRVRHIPVRRIRDRYQDPLLKQVEPGSAYAWGDIVSHTEGMFTFKASANETIKVWLNGRLVHEDDEPGANHARFTAKLNRGTNRFLVQVTNKSGPWNFSIQQLGTTSGPDEGTP